MKTETSAWERQPRLYQGEKKESTKKSLWGLRVTLRVNLHWTLLYSPLSLSESPRNQPPRSHGWASHLLGSLKGESKKEISWKLIGHSLRKAPKLSVPDAQCCPCKPLAFVHSHHQSPTQISAGKDHHSADARSSPTLRLPAAWYHRRQVTQLHRGGCLEAWWAGRCLPFCLPQGTQALGPQSP